tara:strand:+ start:1734 stop:2063 length:330 start_codon:yes stop_codon:yes gene_type:complete
MKNPFGGKLKHCAKLKTNFEEADFWLIRKGSIDTVGKPVQQFSKEHIGVKANELFDPMFLFYCITFLYGQGAFKPLAIGSTNLMNIRLDDVKSVNILNGLNYLSQRSTK